MRVDRKMSCIAGAFALASLISACGGGGDGSSSSTINPGENGNAGAPNATGAALVSKVIGVVVASDSGLPLSAVRVQLANASITTAADGGFTLENVSISKGAVVRFSREGYADTFVTANAVSDRQADVLARMVPIAAKSTFDNATGTTLVDANSVARVVVPSTSLVDAVTGKAPQGAVSIQIGVIDPAANSANMPGGYMTNTGEALESFGALSLQMRDAAGNKLTMAPGKAATIRLPLSSRSAAPPPTIALLYLDEPTGKWVEEGAATLTGVAPKQFYEGNVTRSAVWNTDRKFPSVSVKGCVVDTAGKPVAGLLLRSDGIGYTGITFSNSDASGKFSIGIRKDSRASITAGYPNKSNSLIAEPTLTDLTLPTCIVSSSIAAPPTMISQPLSITAPANSPALFLIIVAGDEPHTYQWFRNGQPISGATQALLQLPNVTAADNQAVFTVRVSGAGGTVTSEPATLTVGPEIPVAEMRKLIELLYKPGNFSILALAPFDQFSARDGISWINPAVVCATGSVTGSLNGQPIPAGTPIRTGNINLIGTFNQCVVAGQGSTINTGTVESNMMLNFEQRKFEVTSKINNFTRVDNQSPDDRSNTTGNGTVKVTTSNVKTSNGTTNFLTLTPQADATLRDNLTGQVTRFVSGSTAITSVLNSKDEEIKTTFDQASNRFSIDGVGYEANGSLSTGRSSLTGSNGSGQLALARNGYQIGRIFANDNGVFLENNGVVFTMNTK